MYTKRLDHFYEGLGEGALQGCADGLHIRLAASLVYYSNYPPKWAEHYNSYSHYWRDALMNRRFQKETMKWK